MSNKQIQEIFQYIQSEGNTLSEKVLKQIQKHPDTLWELIVKLCSRLKNKNIQCAYAQLIFTLAQPDKHDRSSKWLREYMNIRDIAAKFGMNYTVMDFFKPQKQKAINFVAKIVEVNKGLQQVTKEIDVLMTRDQTLDKELIKVKNLKETITKELDELREKKKSQLPTFQALNKETQQVNQQINYMRQLKLDLISGQKQLFEDQKQKQNYFQNLEYLNSIAQIQIQGMKKAVAQNAPEVKKQRRAIEEEYHRVHNQVNYFAQMVKKRQQMALSALEQRQKIKDNVLASIQRLKEELKLVKIEQRQQRQIQNDRQKVQRLLNRSQKTLTEIRNKQKNLDTEINKIKTSEQTHSKYLQRDTILHQQKIQQVEEIKHQIELGKQKIEKGAKVFDSIKSKIFEASSYRETTINRLNMEKQKWLEKCLSELKETYSIFNLERILRRLNLASSN